MLAAGVGSRLYGHDGNKPPKSLLEFGGKTLMRRHIEALKKFGVTELTVVVGFRRDEVMAEAEAHGDGFVSFVENPDFSTTGTTVSLWHAREVLNGGEAVLFMDADVLYHQDLIGRLVKSEHENCIIFDHGAAHCMEAVKLCVRDSHPVAFGKGIEGEFDQVGEWPGFLSLSADVARRLADACQTYIDNNKLLEPMESPLRDVLLSEPKGTFWIEDITGLPWIEIDFPADLIRARDQILPLIDG